MRRNEGSLRPETMSNAPTFALKRSQKEERERKGLRRYLKR